MPKIRQFAVEMALGGRSRDIWERRPPPRPPRLESRTERSFPHSHSDGRCRVKTDGMQKPAKTMSSYRFSCRTLFANDFDQTPSFADSGVARRAGRAIPRRFIL